MELDRGEFYLKWRTFQLLKIYKEAKIFIEFILLFIVLNNSRFYVEIMQCS